VIDMLCMRAECTVHGRSDTCTSLTLYPGDAGVTRVGFLREQSFTQSASTDVALHHSKMLCAVATTPVSRSVTLHTLLMILGSFQSRTRLLTLLLLLLRSLVLLCWRFLFPLLLLLLLRVAVVRSKGRRFCCSCRTLPRRSQV
jgi:hypothetical protein